MNSPKSGRGLDRALVVLFLGGLAAFAFLFFRGLHLDGAKQASGPKSIQPDPTPTTRPSTKDEAAFLRSLAKISSDQWNVALQTPDVHAVSDAKSPACADPLVPPARAIRVSDEGIINDLHSGRQSFVADWYSRCFTVGERIYALRFGQLPHEPVVKIEGFTVVEAVLSSRNSVFPTRVLELLKTDRPTIDQIATKMGKLPNDEVSFLRIAALRPVVSPMLAPIPAIGAYRVYNRQQMSLLKSKGIPLRVLDVRDAETAKAQPLPGSVNAPLTLAGQNRTKFDWTTKVSALKAAPFDVALAAKTAAEVKDGFMIVVGWSATDARPLLAMLRLEELGVKNVIWFYDGAHRLSKIL